MAKQPTAAERIAQLEDENRQLRNALVLEQSRNKSGRLLAFFAREAQNAAHRLIQILEEEQYKLLSDAVYLHATVLAFVEQRGERYDLSLANQLLKDTHWINEAFDAATKQRTSRAKPTEPTEPADA